MKFGTEMDGKHIYILYLNIICRSKITNMATVRKFEVMLDRFIVDIISIQVVILRRRN